MTYELAGDDLLQSALIALGAEDRVAFIKNNVDHHTGATFGCHENYLMRREAQFTPPILGTLLLSVGMICTKVSAAAAETNIAPATK